MKVWICALLILLAANSKAQQYDFILAGQTSNVVYTDLVPDFDTVGHLYTNHLNGTCSYNLDLNNDSIADYEIVLRNEGGLGGSEVTVIISAIDSANRIAAEYDSLYCFPWDTSPSLSLCRSLENGDTIDEVHQKWIPSAFMYYSSWFMAYGSCQKGDWLNNLPHVAGLMMPNQGDTIFGWVRVQAANIYYMNVTKVLDSLVVFDYAATKGFILEQPVNVDDTLLVDTLLKVYPNPSIGNIQVHASEISQFDLVNSAGAMVKSGWLQKGLNNISTEHLTSNYYFLTVYEGDHKKVIKISIVNN